MKEKSFGKYIILTLKVFLTVVVIFVCPCIALLLSLFLLIGLLPINASSVVLIVAGALLFPSLIPFM